MSHEINKCEVASNRANVFVWFTLVLPSEISPSSVTETIKSPSMDGWDYVKSHTVSDLPISHVNHIRTNAYGKELDWTGCITNAASTRKSLWRLELKERLVSDIAEALIPLLNILRPFSVFLKDLTSEVGVYGEIGLAIYTFDVEGMLSMTLDAAILRDIASLGVGIDFDFYYLSPNTPESGDC